MRKHAQHVRTLRAPAFHRRVVGCAIGVIFTLANTSSAANEPIKGPEPASIHQLRLRTGVVTVDHTNSALFNEAFDTSRRYVLGLVGALSPDRRDKLAASGLAIEEYLGGNCVLVKIEHATPATVRITGIVSWATAYHDSWKLDPELTAEITQPRAPRVFTNDDRRQLEARGLRLVAAYLFSGEPLQLTADAVRSIPGVDVLDLEHAGDTQTVIAAIPVHALRRLAEIPSVRFVEELTEFEARDIKVRWVVQSDIPNATPFYDHGITGSGQVVAVIDTQVDSNHCAFLDASNPIGPNHRKIIAYNTPLAAGRHGTEVAGIVVGDAGSFNDLRGVAYGAKMVFNIHPVATEASFIDRFQLHYSQGAFIHTNSWGTDDTRAYNGSCRGIDSFSWSNDDNLVLFAITDHSPIVTNPENAKNCLAVSACGNAPNQDQFCIGGVGPTLDGRRRPEIMGPGCGVRSALSASACGSLSDSGTSMATPAVAGVAALFREYFIEGFYPSGAAHPDDAFVPSGALLKAVLVNSAVDVKNMPGFPSEAEGWGRIVGDQSAYFVGDSRRLIVRQARNQSDSALITGTHATLRVRVNSSSEPLKITLAYHDFPAAINALLTPVNDLDLLVLAPDQSRYAGNAFDNGTSTTRGGFDRMNNLEQVLLPAPAPGVYRALILADAVNVGRQGYALALTGDVSELCAADFNGDGFVTGEDFDLFADAFVAGALDADSDGDGSVTSDDFDAFTLAFQSGC